MNRTDRLFAIVLELQAKRTVRAEDLASSFSVTKRTIYRDIQSLCEAGVPVAAQSGVGYSIVDGYFLPPVNMTNEEAIMLMLGTDFVAQNFDRDYRDAAYSASRKIEAVLSKKLRQHVQELKSSMRFISMSPLRDEHIIEMLKKVRRAVIERKTVRFTYYKRFVQDGEGPLTRNVDPYTLTHVSGNWLMGGYDHRRKATRWFRLSRIDQLEVTDRTFVRPKKFLKLFGEQQKYAVTVKAVFSKQVARWVVESPPFFLSHHRNTVRGLEVTLKSNNEQELIPWLLSWGSNVNIVLPESIRRRLAEESEGLLDNIGRSSKKT